MGRAVVSYIGIATLLALSGCTFYADHPVKSFTDATGGESLERAFWLDIKQQDWKDLSSHIASNFVYVTPAGRLERAAAMEQFEKMRLEDFSIADLTTEMNRDAFVVTYSVILRGTAQGQPLTSQSQQRMTVWQQQKGGWVAIAHSVLGAERN
jgi:hypothetical protein